MTTRAIILTKAAPGTAERRLGEIVDFFGVAHESIRLDDFTRPPDETTPGAWVVFAPLDAFGDAIARPDVADTIRRARAVYVYLVADRAESERTLRRIGGWENAALTAIGPSQCLMSVSTELGELNGAMAGVSVTARPRPEDLALATPDTVQGDTLLTVDGSPGFVRFSWVGVPVYLCTSAAMVDIDTPVAGGFFDVRDYFCSVVPLTMFISSLSDQSLWRPFETGACLIIDDPLLKPSYGFCDFNRLLELMKAYEFTTNVAFIPWNWRRTSSSAAAFFRRENSRFSVSIHGCDHTAQEFGNTSIDNLDGMASLAQSRMKKHEARTGIAHDSVMVFPQGVFSSQCLGVLKRNAFVAAVNTEVSPVDRSSGQTLIRDVWDVAIERYDAFPIFTRRYASHGVANFAFDILLGKPCLIVAHHDFFRDEYAGLVDLVEKLNALNVTLAWRSLGDVIRRAGRHRTRPTGTLDVEMYGSELRWTNSTQRHQEVVVRKKECDAALVKAVRGRNGSLKWGTTAHDLVFTDTVAAGAEAWFAVDYHEPVRRPTVHRPIRVAASVAARRLLCEFRDEYWQKLVQ